MIISDISYLESVQTDVIGGFNLGYDSSYIRFYEDLYIDKDVHSKTEVKGNLATAEADAYGKDTVSQTFTVVDPFYSNSVSISGTN